MLTGYRTIVADPPWEYRHFQPGYTRGKGNLPRLPKPYPSMTTTEIGALRVDELADPSGCRMFLWTTNRHLEAAFTVLRRWGFTYRQTLVWRKTGNPTPLPGHIAPNHAEYVLVGTLGNVSGDQLPSSVLDAPKRRHSEKPEAFLDLIERVSPAPRLEMFARRQRLGWDTWGNQALEHVEIA